MRSLYIHDRERISFPFFLFRGHQLWLKEDSIPQWCRGGSGGTLGCWGCSCRRPGPRPAQGPCVGQLASEAHQLAWRCALQRPHHVTPLQAQSWRDPSHHEMVSAWSQDPVSPTLRPPQGHLTKTSPSRERKRGREGEKEGRKGWREEGEERERGKEGGRGDRERKEERMEGRKKRRKEKTESRIHYNQEQLFPL